MGGISIKNQWLPRNGLSLSSGMLVLGNDLNDPKAPATLSSNREIPTGGFSMYLTGTGKLIIGSATDVGAYAFQLTGSSYFNGDIQIAGFVFNTSASCKIRFSEDPNQGFIRLALNGQLSIMSYNGNTVVIDQLKVSNFVNGAVDFRYGPLTLTKDGQAINTSIASVGQDLRLQAAATFNVTLNVNGGNALIGTAIDNGNRLQVSGNASLFHLVGNSTAPTIAAGTGAGTGPTIGVAGTDLAGTITLTTGTVPAAAAAIATVTFNLAYGAAPRVILQAKNAAAIALAGNAPIPSTTAATLVLTSQAALAATTQYIWDYATIQ